MLSMLVAVMGMNCAWGETVQVTISQYNYATFSHDGDFVRLPDGVKAYSVTGKVSDITNSGGVVEFRLQLEELVPTYPSIGNDEYMSAEMILYSETPGTYELEVLKSDGAKTRSAETSTFGRYSFDNLLIPGVAGLTTEEVMANMEIADEVTELDNKLREGTPATRANDSEYYYYKLTTKDGNNFGFYWGAEDGASFTIKTPNKAYLAILKSLFTNAQTPGAKTRVRFIDETGFLSTDGATGIELIPTGDAPEVEIEEADTYDLLGRKVTTTIPGRIYIKNGKKYIK